MVTQFSNKRKARLFSFLHNKFATIIEKIKTQKLKVVPLTYKTSHRELNCISKGKLTPQ